MEEHSSTVGPAPPAAAPLSASTSGPGLLSHSTLVAVRRLVHAYREDGAVEIRLRRAARAVAADAHRQGARAEQMLVAVKQEWAALPEVRALPPGDAVQNLSSRFITLCSREFFSSDAPPAIAPRRAD